MPKSLFDLITYQRQIKLPALIRVKGYDGDIDLNIDQIESITDSARDEVLAVRMKSGEVLEVTANDPVFAELLPLIVIRPEDLTGA